MPKPDSAAPLAALLSPRNVAVIGASRDPKAIGHQILRNLAFHGFQGSIFPVNPNATSILGFRCYASVLDVPDPVDLAVIVVPARLATRVAEECGRKGVSGLVVITAGFRETDEAGAQRERDLRDIVRRYGMRMVGPNCMGVLNSNPAVNLNATFAPRSPRFGPVGLMTQSGALGIAVLDLARDRGLGISRFVSLGNKTDVSGNDLLSLWEDDPDVGTILMYIESFGNPRNFIQLARRIGRTKPIIAVKSGRSQGGARAAGSHTGALAERDVLVDALFDQCGVVRANGLETLFDIALAVANQPPPPGPRLGILTNSGGPAIMAVDALEGTGLTLAEFGATTAAALRKAVVAEASVTNPVDLLAAGGPESYHRTASAILADPNVDSLLAIYTPPMVTDDEAVARALVEAKHAHPGKPMLVVFLGRGSPEPAKRVLADAGIPVYAFPEGAVRALAAMNRIRALREREPGQEPTLKVRQAAARRIVDAALARGDAWLTQDDALALVAAYGLPVAASRMVDTPKAAADAARRIGFPVVVKGQATGLVHKTEHGAIRLNLTDEAAVAKACHQMQQRLADDGFRDARFLVMKQAEPGREMLVGLTQDDKFGPLVACGLGGVDAEVYQDVAFHLAPLTDADARRMVDGLRTRRLLEGHRGTPGSDRAALEDAVIRVARLGFDLPQVRELDLNPVLVHPQGRGVTVVDARVRVARPPGPAAASLEQPVASKAKKEGGGARGGSDGQHLQRRRRNRTAKKRGA